MRPQFFHRAALAAQRPRPAFTLVELLVVIAIIGILVALLLPAIQAAREAAKRSQCQNNIRQLALGFNTYLDVNRTFPVGSRGINWETWQVLVLPFIEHKQLYEAYMLFEEGIKQGKTDFSFTWNNQKDVIMHHIPSLLCPSDEPQINQGANHNYLANYGNGSVKGTSIEGLPVLHGPFKMNHKYKQRLAGTSFKQIVDGMSHTLAAAEVLQGKGSIELRGQSYFGGASGMTTFAGPNALLPDNVHAKGHCVSTEKETSNPPCINAPGDEFYLSRSRHPGGVSTAMCDGAVRFTSDDISIHVWRAVGSINGKEVVASAFFD